MPKRKPASSQSGDVDALAFDPDDTRDPRSKAFISREGSRKRGLEIAFDPEKHKCAFWILQYTALECQSSWLCWHASLLQP
jgi:hypothetical protein